ncbi:protein TIME FOR COFFEE-like isoform X2 [Musa acuminata AAA Group]|uniref:protein TIME FOR COFFEE-like isoform X2 n=1 Tax=Musa acuminata AAA Group TaxID=214697 RepID=UPI0031D92B4F
MERNREARRGTTAASTATNGSGGGGGGLSRRRQRNSSGFRDSPEDDGRMEMPETSRLRDRGAKKDRDRNRSSRLKRRRGERMLHGSNRDEGDQSSENSIDEDEEDEDDDLFVPVRLPTPSPPLPNPGGACSSSQQNHHHHHHQQQQQQLLPRKNLPPKVMRWKTDAMIGVTIPRKARSASKRSHESLVLGGGGGGGEQITQQASISPSSLSPASATQLTPPSSNGSLRKKMHQKQITGAKHRPPKISKSTSFGQDEIEIEVAEVLYGMTRRFECLPKQDNHKLDSKDVDGGSGNEAKSRVSSPSSPSPSPAAYPSALPSSNSCSNPAPLPTIAPKRKRPRPVRFDEESSTSPVGLYNLSSISLSSITKMDPEHQIKAEASSPRSEKNNASPAIIQGGGSADVLVSQAGLSDMQQQESSKTEKKDLHPSSGGSDARDGVENKEELVSPAKDSTCTDVDANLRETPARKIVPDSPKEVKMKIDLMAPPPGKLSPDAGDLHDFDSDLKQQGPEIEMALKMNNENKEEKATESALVRDGQQTDKSMEKDFDLKKQVAIKQNLDLQLDLENPKQDIIVTDKVQMSKLQVKDPKAEPKQEKSASSLHVPVTVGAWPGTFPPYGYIGQVPHLQAVVPMDATACHSNSSQLPALHHMHSRPKRCITHCYIAQMISNHQKFARMNSFWTAAAGAAPFLGVKNCNLTSEAALSGKPMLGSFLGMNIGSMEEGKATPALIAAYTGLTSQEKMPAATKLETTQRKQLILQQMPQSGTATNMPHGPAFMFPINHQQNATASTVAAAANRAGAAKSSTGAGAAELRVPGDSGSAVGNGGSGGSASPMMNLSFNGFPSNEAQYLAFLQSNAYPFPMPPHITGATPFRGASYPQAMPFFYPSHMLHPSQLRPQQQHAVLPLPPHAQQSHQNPGTSNGSSQKQLQQSQCIGESGSGRTGSSSHSFLANQRHDLPQHSHAQEYSKGMEDNLSVANAAIAISSGGGHGDKQAIYQQAHQKQNVKVDFTSPQPFGIPGASFGGILSAPPGIDFSSIAQNHAIFQSLPDASRYGYHQMAAAAAQAAEQKKVHKVAEDGKPVARELVNTNMTSEDNRKIMSASKGPGNCPQNSFTSTKSEGEPPISSVVGNNVVAASRSLNLIQATANGGVSADRSPGIGTASTPAPTVTTSIANSPQQQHHFYQIQKQQQQQQQLQMHHQLASSRTLPSATSNNVNVHPERPGDSTSTKFPQSLTSYPQALIQGGSPTQWPQAKTSAARGAVPAATAPTPVVKNSLLQLQGRVSQQPLPTQSHQAQISFGTTSSKVVPSGGQHLLGACGSLSPSSAAVAVGSPSNSNSASKSAGGSPRSCTSVKPGPQSSAIPLPQQSTVKQSALGSISKSLPMSNSSMPSILGHPQKVPGHSSNTKQQQPSQQLQKQQPFSQAQLFFSNPHMQQVASAQPGASAPNAAQYYHKRQPEQTQRQSQQQQQQNSAVSSSGMLSVCASSALMPAGSSTSSDPAKAMTAMNSMKGLPPPCFFGAAQLAVAAQSASGSPHPSIPATFAYMSLPSVSMKPSAEQKPAAGSDNLQSWQAEKR